MSKLTRTIEFLLNEFQLHPVLIDVGAIGYPPKVWLPIAGQSIFVGFDPNLETVQAIPDSPYYKATIINKAITANPDQSQVEFYFTKADVCSSTLPPNHELLADYEIADRFQVEKKVSVAATTLDSVLTQLALPTVHWLKLDTQGTDLRLFNSLKDPSHVMAVDVEPGLMPAYQGEDVFAAVHPDLMRQGFWLSDMQVLGTPRIRREYLTDPDTALPLKKSPLWCELRYLRTVDALEGLEKPSYILLWVFALLDDQFGFAVDVGHRYEKVFGKDGVSQILREQPLRLMRRTQQLQHTYSTQLTKLQGKIVRQSKRLLRQYGLK